MKKDPQPPKLFHRFFLWFCRPGLRDHIEGDLLETYRERLAAHGNRRADGLFRRDVIQLLRPEIMGRPSIHINRNTMFKSYLKIGWRNLIRNRSYAAINIAGLAVGVAACLLIALVIQFETSFDNFHPHPDRIFRVVAATKTPDGISYSRASGFPVAQGLRMDFPALPHVARIWAQDGVQVTVMNDKNSVSEKKFKEDLFFADPAFFNIFHFPFAAGNAETALSQPNSVVLSQETANKYFGDWHVAVNQYIKQNNFRICKVTGVLQDPPANTDFPLQLVFSARTSRNDTSTDWVSQTGNLSTFVELPENVTAGQFNNDLVRFVKKHTPSEYANQGYVLQPLNDIHYNAVFGNFRGTTFSHELITTICIIGVFLLVIACVNFINLSTAQAVNRSKEVGVRKVLGSQKKQLVLQFLTETFLITFAAVCLGVVIAWLALPWLNGLLHTAIKIRFSLPAMVIMLAGMLAITLLSGFYPAVILSGFSPVTVLKSKFSNKMVGGLTLRRVLVVFQFVIAQALIIGTLVVVKQMNFFSNAAMGFDREAIITADVPNDSLSQSRAVAFKHALLQQPGIKGISFSTFSPADDSHWGSDFKFDNAVKTTDFNADLKWADPDYFDLYHLKFVAGGPYREADSVTGFVINKMLAGRLGFKNPADILGKKIDFWDGGIVARVVGVVEDFHGTTLVKPMKPIVLGSFKNSYQLVNIKLQPGDPTQTLAAVKKLWSAAFPDYVYEYQFLDEKIASFYRQEKQLGILYKAFAAIAIFISCLGLFGLVSFMAVQRTKEVGIRKVLGASVMHILYLFSREFTVLIGVAFLVAAPAAGVFMHSWLQHFAYRTDMGMGVFLLTMGMAVLFSWITVGYQAIKAAVAKPVNSLRAE